jgi:hypothetical protein
MAKAGVTGSGRFPAGVNPIAKDIAGAHFTVLNNQAALKLAEST